MLKLSRFLSLVLVVAGILLVPAAAHAASGSQEITVVGPGKVTGTGIDCPPGCTASRTWTTPLPPTNRLTATPTVAGHAVVWDGCTVVVANPSQCDAGYGDSEIGEVQVTATFVDVAAPSVSMTSPAAGARVGGNFPDFMVSATATDNDQVASVRFNFGNTSATDTTAPYGVVFNAAKRPSGDVTLEVIATDRTGNSTWATRSITIDNTPPTLIATGGVENGHWYAQGFLQLQFEAGLDAATLTCRGYISEPPPWETCINHDRYEVGPASDGPFAMEVRAYDDLGNFSEIQRFVNYDSTPPVIDLGAASPSLVRAGTPTNIALSVTEANLAELLCRAPGDPYAPCDTDFTATDLNSTEGTHTWRFRATDLAGNVTDAERSWIVDGTAPAVAIGSGPAEGATVPAGVVSFDPSAEDPLSGVKSLACSWDGETFGACGSRALAPGAHSFRVRAEDNVGLVTLVERNFTVAQPQGDAGGGGGGGGGDGTGGNGGSGGGTPDGGSGTNSGGGTPDRIAPSLKVAVAKTVRAATLRKGLQLRLTCSEACRGTLSLTGPRGLRRTAKVTAGQSLRLRIPATQLKRLLGARRPKLTLTVVVADAAGNRASRTLAIVVRT